MTSLPDTVVILRSVGTVLNPIPVPVPVDLAAALSAASSFRDDAEDAAVAAEDASAVAASAATSASAAATSAATSATAAAASATSAAGSAATATTQAATATTQASAAAASATSAATDRALVQAALDGLLSGFYKSNPDAPCLSLATTQTVVINQDIGVVVGSLLRKVASGTAVDLPALVAGTDYAVYVCADGSVRADANFSAPTGYTAANSRKIGGFYYGPGSMATAQAGGDTTPQILAHSFWDLKWRPRCPDPRGMGFVSASVGWVDLWPLGVNWIADGTSRMGATIADGASPPKKPLTRGGNGATAYSSLTLYEATEIFQSVGKTLLSYAEYQAAAYGTTEAISRGNDPVTTGFATTNAGSSNADQKFTSAYMYMASGVQWWWSRDLLYRADGADAAAITAYSWKDVGRGSAYTQGTNGIVAGVLGGLWAYGTVCGPRASDWYAMPWASDGAIGARGRCDHLFHV